MPSKTMTRASGLGCILTLREIPTFPCPPIQQARNSAAQFNERRNRRSRQRDHLVVPSTDAFDEIEHFSQSQLHHRIDALVVPTHLDALTQSLRGRIEF